MWYYSPFLKWVAKYYLHKMKGALIILPFIFSPKLSQPIETKRGLRMAANEGFKESEEFVYRISTAEEWEELQRSAATFGGDLDQSTGCFHLSKLNQVQSTLQNFFLNVKEDLYLLQIDAKKLGDGLIYEAADDSNIFPHFYGPSRSFSPLPLDAVVKAEKLTLSDGKFNCSLLN